MNKKQHVLIRLTRNEALNLQQYLQKHLNGKSNQLEKTFSATGCFDCQSTDGREISISLPYQKKETNDG